MNALRSFALAASLAGAVAPGPAPAAAPAAFSPSAAQRGSAGAITPALLRAHVKFLASDLLSGMVEDVQMLFHLAVVVANAREMPRWLKGDEFAPARERALRSAAGGER